MEKLAKRNGITLIVLIITIIVLLILSGVVLSLTLGDGGIFNISKNASKNYMEAQNKELEDLDKMYSEIKIATNDDSQITISIDDLNQIIDTKINEKLKNGTANPVGAIISQMGNVAPDGYLFCNGDTYNIEEYKNLSEYIKEQFGTYNYFGGNGETTFAIPDLRGEFLRCTGTARKKFRIWFKCRCTSRTNYITNNMDIGYRY